MQDGQWELLILADSHYSPLVHMTTFRMNQNRVKKVSAIANPTPHIFTVALSTSRSLPNRLRRTYAVGELPDEKVEKRG